RTLALDVGTTTYLLSGLLLNHPHTKIFTNGVRNAVQLCTGFGEVYLPGGRMRGEEMASWEATSLTETAPLRASVSRMSAC
ncbi:hypothetical protein ACC736_39150, partial [Rhizobium ruizarguesonis]